MARLHELFHYLRDNKGSDLHLAAGLEPRIRKHGALEPVAGWPVLSHEDLCDILREIASDEDWEEYERAGDLDFAYGFEGVARFRANYLRQENGAGAVFRIIPEDIVPLEKLNLPKAIESLAHLQQGLVLVTGPTGSGKSTTLAAIIDRINTSYSKHIVTIEDPVEFVHKSKKSIFSQREVGADTESFGAALRSAIRQDADVILVGEMRDLETVATALTAAETGHLVLSTLHTNDAAQAVHRIVDVFPPAQQAQIRHQLALALNAIVVQQLVPRVDGRGRLPAVEVLHASYPVRHHIRSDHLQKLYNELTLGKRLGMIAMEDSLAQLVRDGKIDLEEAKVRASHPDELAALLRRP